MADAQGTAGSVIKGVGPLLGMVPYVGPLLSMAASIGGGALEASAAKKQAEQAAKLRKQTDAMQPGQLQPEYYKKFQGDQALALAGLPGIDLYKDWLAGNMATNLRSIKENSPNGAASVNAISLALGGENAAINKLGMADAEYRAKYNDAALSDLWNLGDKKQGLVDANNERKKLGYAQANNLEAAATGNKQTAWNTILGSIGSTATELTKNFENDMWSKSFATNNVAPEAAPQTGYDNNGFEVSKNPNSYLADQSIWGVNNYSNQLNSFNPNNYQPQ